MKISRSTIHVLVVLEALVLILVIVLSIIQPWAVTQKHDLGSESTEDLVNDNIIPEFAEPVYSEEIMEMVADMTLEQKAAQMFITTPEQLAGVEESDELSKKIKTAIKKYTLVEEEDIAAYEDGGVSISDDWMDNYEEEDSSLEEAAVAAVQSGIELLYCPEDFSKAYKGVLKAVEDEELAEEMIDDAVLHILACKEQLED